MKLFFHYCLFGFANCYVLGADPDDEGDAKDALVIDPGCMDEKLLSFIEDNDYAVRGILITHDHQNHVHGLKTMKRIYNVPVYAADPSVCEERANIIHDNQILTLGQFKIEVFSVPGHSSDSVVFRIDKMLFTGDALSAGLIGTTASEYGRAILSDSLKKKILSLPGNYVVLPGHGPPSNLEAERRFNAGLEAAERAGVQRAALVRDIR
jgi:hydroxyacylglutathione hydrolase